MKTMARQIGTVLCMALALLSAFYAFAVMKTHSGTGFWKVWLVIAAVFALLAVGIAANWGVALPRIIRGVIIAVVCIGIAIFGTVEGCIISNMHARGDQHLDYVVVLGAQVRKSGPSKALRYRLDTAADYLRNSPDTICIVSGGKGANEPFPEAQGMADYLKAHGIEEGRILQESSRKPPRRISSTARSSLPETTRPSASSPMTSTCSAHCRSRMTMDLTKPKASRPVHRPICW